MEATVAGKREAFREFMNSVIKDYFGYQPGKPEHKDAVDVLYRRFGKAARDILALALGDPKTAKKAVDAIGARMDKNGLSWNLDTCVNWYTDWHQNPKGFEDETNNPRIRRK